ncbi:2Fe-2S iron-sulfur cluster-binding protein [Gemmobacter sp. 24YEA27]|uniref:2Fe-2S iron-sulfur cluster-binding protein n=1 Tax=Gemmobacter sp. 24YEA27 TaxID=3040672 RepID=UPI0024B3438C|nr:2Fe-2S iron-sulfur cluster-binding protein [Gemmobacter sp. 24YEA27]
MLNITFIQPDGSRREIEAMPHESAMEAAMRHDVGGIVAECGGSCMCATCHVYVDAAFLGIAGAAGDMEQGMLEMAAAELRPESRLACQLIMAPEMDGLILHVAERQI